MNRALAFTITNALLFQIGWLVCILWGDLAAICFTIPALAFHFIKSSVRFADMVAVVVAIALGFIHDSVLIHAGYIVFTESAILPPLWLFCLWALLGITLNHSLRWIYSRPLWSAVLGAACGPLSYWAGVSLSSADWSSPTLDIVPVGIVPLGIVPIMAAIPLIAIMWSLVLPLHRLLSLRVLSYVANKNASRVY